MFFRTLKMAFWVTYDHLGKLLLANLFVMTVLSLPIVAASTLLSASQTAFQSLIGLVLLAIAIENYFGTDGSDDCIDNIGAGG